MVKRKIAFKKNNKTWNFKLPLPGWKLITFICVVVLILSIFLFFFYTQPCKDDPCFKDGLASCKRVSYTTTVNSSTWSYDVKGYLGNDCLTIVKAVSLVGDEQTIAALQGKEMYCYLPKTLLATGILPEQKIEYCHGLLKEGIQDIIIERMHLYIVQNLAQKNQSAQW
ncbi:hypothetical protein COS75_03035 [Candidatus Pacearchaeota archaeon CG06_land_8_20_14_3_00_35_12]|nr:MAG: hypothetical protein COS75_03035 [Candidatus Pacearchaeota archaeon CG06_land_8_20_14_3_00_35_12]